MNLPEKYVLSYADHSGQRWVVNVPASTDAGAIDWYKDYRKKATGLGLKHFDWRLDRFDEDNIVTLAQNEG